MKICDLHTHTYYSDGSYSPAELAQEAKRVGLSAIAITDHNNVGGAEEFLKECEKQNIEGIIGTEFSTDYKNIELHLLGLFIKKESLASVNSICEEVRKNKEESKSFKAFALFVLVDIIGLLATILVMTLQDEFFPVVYFKIFGLNIDIIWLLCKCVMTLVCLIWNYIGRKKFIFK